jgi:putative intracellular protease/amidase
MAANRDVGHILSEHYQNGKVIAAICAGPRALLAHQIGSKHQHTITCYPTVRQEFIDGQPYKLDLPTHPVCHSTYTDMGKSCTIY